MNSLRTLFYVYIQIYHIIFSQLSCLNIDRYIKVVYKMSIKAYLNFIVYTSLKVPRQCVHASSKHFNKIDAYILRDQIFELQIYD